MPPIVHVTKEAELKALHQHINKAWEWHQQRTVWLNEIQETLEQLALKEMEGIANTKEAWAKVA